MDGLKTAKPKEQQAGFNPIKADHKNYPTLLFEKKTLIDFNSIIDNIEKKIKEGLKKQKEDEKKIYRQQQQKPQNNTNYNKKYNIVVGIPEDGRVKIKIKGHKGESLISHFDKLVRLLTELAQNVNSKISELSDYNDYIQEDKNLELSKKLIEIRNKQQPNCAGEKYKTTNFFSSAFNTKLTDTNSSTINQQIYKDIEKCIEYLLSIIVEYCSKTGIMTPETHSYVQLNKDVLFESEKIKGQYGGKTKKQTKKQTKNKQHKSKTNKHITRKHKKY
jgi:hypothetical protein